MEMFNEFLGKEVKVPYKDGSQFKIARGVLIENKEGFVRFCCEIGGYPFAVAIREFFTLIEKSLSFHPNGHK